MSGSTLPSDHANRPTSDNVAPGGNPIPEDPLLKSGSFIEPTFKDDDHPERNGDVQSPNPRDVTGHQDAETASAQGQRTPKSSTVPERPDWLPEGWGFDFRIRSSGVSAGMYDRYYIDPASNHRFRSKKEVDHYLETGMLKRPALDSPGENSHMSSSSNQKGKKSSSKRSAGQNFDPLDVPEEIRWSLTDAINDKWAAFNGDESIPESTTQVWSSYFYLAAHK